MLAVLTYPVKEPNSLENHCEKNYQHGVNILRKLENAAERR